MNLTAAELIDELQTQGIEVEARRDRLLLRPASSMTPELVERLRRNKPDMLRLLADRDFERLIDEMLAQLNVACPPACRLSDDDWQALDAIQKRIDAARLRRNLPALAVACGDYERTARTLFSTTDPNSTDAKTANRFPWLDDVFKPKPDPTPWCPRYRHSRAWRSIFGDHLICATCHPPLFENLVAEWIG